MSEAFVSEMDWILILLLQINCSFDVLVILLIICWVVGLFLLLVRFSIPGWGSHSNIFYLFIICLFVFISLFFFVVLEIKPKALCLPGRPSTTELHLQPYLLYLFLNSLSVLWWSLFWSAVMVFCCWISHFPLLQVIWISKPVGLRKYCFYTKRWSYKPCKLSPFYKKYVKIYKLW
jgi:hypothetical protein